MSFSMIIVNYTIIAPFFSVGKGGKNRRRGKNENESEKRELVFKEDGQGKCKTVSTSIYFVFQI